MVQINSPEDGIINSYSKEERFDELLCPIFTELFVNNKNVVSADWGAQAAETLNLTPGIIAQHSSNLRERLCGAYIAKILKKISQL